MSAAAEALNIALYRLLEAQHKMTVSQSQFDADLTAFLAAEAAYETAVNAYIAAVGTAAPNLATEDASVAGDLRIDSPPGGGTRVVAEIPCP